MRARSQAENKNARMWVAKPGDRPAPVNLITVSPALFKRNFFPPFDQAWTTAAIQELFIELRQCHDQILPHKGA